jgi:predicted metal-binding membrane protein
MIANPHGEAQRHDRIVVMAGLVVLVAASWVYLLRGAGIEMDEMDMGGGQIMLMAPAWTFGYAALVLLMWVVMMAAMMLPAATPAILQAVGAAGERGGKTSGIASALLFTAGYLMVWIAFSAAATVLQWGLDSADLLSDTMASRSAVAAGLLLVAVGLYQWTPLKQSCLRRCRACADGLPQAMPESAGGLLRRGLRYGAACLGCCGALMGLLFVGGVMNVLWIAAIAVGVLAEKLLPGGGGLARVAGAGLIAWGIVSLAVALF